MVSDRPSLRQLEYLVAIDDHGSFSGGARACGVTQPALSSQIRRLEEMLGVELLERRPGGVIPTEAGSRTIDMARGVLAQVEGVVATAQSMQDPLRGTIRMGVIPTVAPYLLPEITPRLRERFPELRLLLKEARTEDLVALVQGGELDVALVALESELGDLVTHSLLNDPFLLAVSHDHRLAARKRVHARDLHDEEVLLLDDGHCLRDQTLAICNAAGACELGDFRATSLATLVQMVEAGVGVTMLPRMAVRTHTHLGDHLRLIPFGAPEPGRTVALAWRETSPVHEHYRLLAEALASQDFAGRGANA